MNFSRVNDWRFVGVFNYLIAYDYMSGKKSRYNVFIMNADDPITIGRELKFLDAQNIVIRFEIEASKLENYSGESKKIEEVYNRVFSKSPRMLSKESIANIEELYKSFRNIINNGSSAEVRTKLTKFKFPEKDIEDAFIADIRLYMKRFYNIR